MALSNAEKQRQYRMRCKVTKTADELEEIRRKNRERVRRYRERKRQRVGGVKYSDDCDADYTNYSSMNGFGNQGFSSEYSPYQNQFKHHRSEYLPTPCASPFMDAAKLASASIQPFYQGVIKGPITPPLADGAPELDEPERLYEQEMSLFKNSNGLRYKRRRLLEDSESDISDLESQAALALLDISKSSWNSSKAQPTKKSPKKKGSLSPLAAPIALKTGLPLLSSTPESTLSKSRSAEPLSVALMVEDAPEPKVPIVFTKIEESDADYIPPPPPPASGKNRIAAITRYLEPLLTIPSVPPPVPNNSPVNGAAASSESINATRQVLEAVSLKVECFILQKETTVNGRDYPRRGSWTSGIVTPTREKPDGDIRLATELGLESSVSMNFTVAPPFGKNLHGFEQVNSSFATPPRSPKKAVEVKTEDVGGNPLSLSSLVNKENGLVPMVN